MNDTPTPAIRPRSFSRYKGFLLSFDVIRTDAGLYTASVTVTRDDGKQTGRRGPVLFQRGYPKLPAADTEDVALARAIGTGEAYIAQVLGAPLLQ